MSMHAIKDTTLTALGDAIRSKVIGVETPEEVYTHTFTNINTSAIVSPTFKAPKYKYLIGGSITNDMMYSTITVRETNSLGAKLLDTVISNSMMPYEIITDCNVLHIMVNIAYSSIQYDCNVTIIGLDENGNEFKYTPLEMVDELKEMLVAPADAFYLTGDKSYAFQRDNNLWMINTYGDKITTDKLTNISYMFQYSTMESIPFDLNIDSSKTNVNSPNLFYNCSNLKEAPLINNYYVYTCNAMFNGCQRLRYLPDGFAEDWDFSGIHNGTNSLASFFSNCYSLRAIPEVLRKNLWNKSTASYSGLYSSGFSSCYSLDELTDLGITTASLTSNMFNSTFYYTFRLAELTFEVNEDGTAKAANWKSQTIDLSQYVGYINGSASSVTSYNSGITADKQVTDDASYQALKNDPDWFTCDINYSRYNHDSAVNTINSLPDCSATGTNTIKFKGASGAKTDGGAINTLTEAEIAVAAAKGWTVSLV